LNFGKFLPNCGAHRGKREAHTNLVSIIPIILPLCGATMKIKVIFIFIGSCVSVYTHNASFDWNARQCTHAPLGPRCYLTRAGVELHLLRWVGSAEDAAYFWTAAHARHIHTHMHLFASSPDVRGDFGPKSLLIIPKIEIYPMENIPVRRPNGLELYLLQFYWLWCCGIEPLTQQCRFPAGRIIH
jgi:hypothetical protein